MNALETQLGQIHISNKKLSKSFVCLLSEKLQVSGTEIYTLLEAPILAGGSVADYEKVAKAIQAVLRKNMLTSNENGFENSIAQINEDLSKLAEKGWANWIGKMNACIASRQNEKLFLATTGKIHAYLFRDKQFSDIADSPKTTNPLKVFENFATGKVSKRDFLFLTTTQLFNYISIERIKDILTHNSLQKACETIAEIVTQIAEPQISFGTFIIEVGADVNDNQQFKSDFPVLPNTPTNKYIGAASAVAGTAAAGIASQAKNAAKNMAPFFAKIWAFLKKPNFSALKMENIKKLNLKDLSPVLVAKKAKEIANLEKIKQLPKIKKFFLASAIVFVLILIVNLGVAAHVRNQKKKIDSLSAVFTEVQHKIVDANTAYIYEDKAKAFSILQDAKNQLSAVDASANAAAATQKEELTKEVTELINSIGGLKTATVREVATNDKGNADRLKLIGNNLYLINNSANYYIPLNWQTSKFGTETTLSNSPEATALNTAESGILYTDKDGNIYQANLGNSSADKQAANIGPGISAIVFYGSPTKIYGLNKSQNQITSAEIGKTDPAKNYLQQNVDLSSAIDIAIDGSIYVLMPNQVLKFTKGLNKAFSNPGLTYSSRSKIFASKDLSYEYILDPESKRIIVLDSRGGLKAQYTSDQFTDIKDFTISADGKSAYILNGQKVLEVTLN